MVKERKEFKIKLYYCCTACPVCSSPAVPVQTLTVENVGVEMCDELMEGLVLVLVGG